MRRLLAWCRRHRATTTLVIFVAVFSVPLVRIQQVAGRADETSREVKAEADARAEASKDTALGNCRSRNTGSRQTRASFSALYDTLDQAFPKNAQTLQFTQLLRERAGGPSVKRDLDCDGNGRLDENDYADCPGQAPPCPEPPSIPTLPPVTTTTAAARSSPTSSTRRGTTTLLPGRLPATTTSTGSPSTTVPCTLVTIPMNGTCISVPPMINK